MYHFLLVYYCAPGGWLYPFLGIIKIYGNLYIFVYFISDNFGSDRQNIQF